MEKQVLSPGHENGKMYERGCFSKVVRANGFLFLSGLTAQWDHTTGEQRQAIRGDIRLQAEIIFSDVKKTLESVGSSLDKVVKTTTYLSDIRRINEVSEVRRKFFLKDPPASTTVAVTGLNGIAELEIEVIALA